MTDETPHSDSDSTPMRDALDQLSRTRLLSLAVTIALLVVTAVAFVQVISGHLAVHKMGLTETEIVDHSTDVGDESVTVRVENPTSKEFEVTSVLIHGFVGEDSVNQDARKGLDNVMVPPNGNTTFTVPLNVPDDRRGMVQGADSLRFEGNVRIQFADERMLVDIGPTEVEL